MDPQRFSAKAKEDRVRREKRGLHGYMVGQDEPIVPLCVACRPNITAVSGLVHEDEARHEDFPRDEPIAPLSPLGPPAPVSGLVHEDYVPRDGPSIRPIAHVVAPSLLYGLMAENSRNPDILPCICEALRADEIRMQLQVDISCWREVKICLAMLRTKARHPYIKVFLGNFNAYWSINTRESAKLWRTSRPGRGPNFVPSLSGGRYHEC